MKMALKFGLLLALTASATQAALPNYRKVSLGCRNPGSHQDVAKTPIITNTTNHSLSSTIKVYWNATDGDKGYVQGPFAINESKQGLGQPGNGYQCSAYYWVKIF